MEGRIPASGNSNQITGQLAHRAILFDDIDRLDPRAPMGSCEHCARNHAYPRLFASFGGARISRRPSIDEGDIHSCCSEVERGRIGGIVVGEDDGLLPRPHTKTMQPVPHCRSEHDAGPIAIGEGNGAFESARCDNHLPRPDFPVSEIEIAGVARVAFKNRHEMMLVIAPGCGRHQAAHLRHRTEFSLRPAHPMFGISPRAEKLSARFCPVIHKDHPRAGTPCGQRCPEPCRAGADDQQIAIIEAAFTDRLPGVVSGHLAKPRCAANERLEQMPGRPHEGLVVEPRRQQP